ncbi:MAG: ribonuclease III [Desulfatiglandales bacterium]
MNKEQKESLSTLEEKISYRFNEPKLLVQALTHSSYINEHTEEDIQDNERLEFLGDAVLDLAVGDMLFRHYQDADEGKLSRFRAVLVDERGLFEQAQKIDLGEYLLLGRGEEQGGGRHKPKVLAGSFEALLGAVYLDGGYDAAYRVIESLFGDQVEGAAHRIDSADPKSTLQEFTQASYKCLPDYKVIAEEGPPHERSFKIALYLKGELISIGKGRSKKEAEQEAAKEALNWLKARETYS